MRSLNLDQLRTFVEVAALGNFSAAGRTSVSAPKRENSGLNTSSPLFGANARSSSALVAFHVRGGCRPQASASSAKSALE